MTTASKIPEFIANIFKNIGVGFDAMISSLGGNMDIIASKANTIYATQGLNLSTSIPVPGANTITGKTSSILNNNAKSNITHIGKVEIKTNNLDAAKFRQMMTSALAYAAP